MFRLHLSSKFVKRANMIKNIIFKNAKWVFLNFFQQIQTQNPILRFIMPISN
jgi:hypothetical protein